MYNPLIFLFLIYQSLTAKLLSPNPPNPHQKLRRPRIAIIGAGITGVTAAAHCVGHGFDVTIFEAGGEDQVGGIWTRVNDTSGLQIHSLMYRFHPSVQWREGYPNRREIVAQVKRLFREYGLEKRTRFDTKVDRVYRDKGCWVVNDASHGRFDGVIAAVGTCGKPKMLHIQGMDEFKGDFHHSSELTGKNPQDKKVVIIGGGASAVEALEFAAKDAQKITILSRSDKWIIPRNIFVDTLLSFNVFGHETVLSFIPEFLLKKLFYRGLEDLAPEKGIFTDTPMVNSDVMDKLREGKAEWVRCDIEEFEAKGVLVNRRTKGVPQGGPGHRELIEADIVIMATGFTRPSLSFLPDECFAEPYAPPNWYLQTFPPPHASVSAVNCTYLSAIGSVGNWHIGIYTRILLMFLVDPLTRPREAWMRRWVDMTRVLKRSGPTGAFDFFTYLELVWWFVFCVAVNPFRWKWAVFVFLGVGGGLPEGVVRGEDKMRWSRQRGEVVKGQVKDEGREGMGGKVKNSEREVKDGEGEDLVKGQAKESKREDKADGEKGDDTKGQQVEDEERGETEQEGIKEDGVKREGMKNEEKREQIREKKSVKAKVTEDEREDKPKGEGIKADGPTKEEKPKKKKAKKVKDNGNGNGRQRDEGVSF